MPFLGLTYLYFVNIQSNLKFHSPRHNFLNPLMIAGSSFYFEPPPHLKNAGCAPVIQSFTSNNNLMYAA